MPRKRLLLHVLLGLVLMAPLATAQEPQLVRMGTGSVAGVYYSVGVSLCRLANQHRPETNLRCAAVPTEGSVANLTGLRDGAYDFAIVQSDVEDAALTGGGVFADKGPDDELRSVMSLYPEVLTVLVGPTAGVARIEDLAGKRVALGREGSGTRALADALLGALGWTPASFAETPDIDPTGLPRTLCDGAIDGFLYTVGHPALVIQEATTSCAARLLPVEGAAVDELVASRPYLVPGTIPGGLYQENPRPIPSFGVGALLVTRAEVPEDTVYTVVRSIFRDIHMLRGLDPVLENLDPVVMATKGLEAPLHPGAARFYRDSNLIR